MNIKNGINSYFNQIKADKELKKNIKDYLTAKTNSFSEYKKSRYYNLPLKLCAAFLAVFICGGLFFIPTAEIGLDINPSIELLVNSFNMVVDAKGLNADGDKLLSSLNIRYKSYETAFNDIISNNTIKALLDKNEILSVTVSGINNGQTKTIYNTIESCPMVGSGVRCQYMTTDEYRAAHKLGLTCGKYRAYLYLSELGSKITPDDIRNMKMKDIRRLIYELSGESLGGAIWPFCLNQQE